MNFWLLCALLLPAAPPSVEARTADGSVVRLTVLQESLEVQTKYGRLTVPLRDVRKIEFGLHYPAGVKERVETAVIRLGSTSHRQREDAEAELLALGEYSYPAVHAAAKAADMETAERAKRVLAQLDERLPAERRKVNTQDRIDTHEFTVIGRIVGATLKATSPLFGEHDLPLAALRSVRVLGSGGAGELTVDAAKHGSPASPWLDTGIDVDAAAPLLVTATGQVDLWPATPGQYTTGPAGYRNAGTVQGSGHHAGTLLGKIGEHGKVFVVGDRFDARPDQEGRLYLAIAPSPWNNAAVGGYTVKIGGGR